MRGTPVRPIVIDTNIWLDLLVFGIGENRKPAAVAVCEQFDSCVLATNTPIVSCEGCRAELADVLQRKQFHLTQSSIEQALQNYEHLTIATQLPDQSPTRLLCTDRDDQKFLDLAVHSNAMAILTRDKALLKLARAANKQHDLYIGDINTWAGQIAKPINHD